MHKGRYMETATISIIVPVYNIIEYLPRCVESLRKQTYDKIEILLVDDGSTDGTAELCDKLAVEDVRIRVFHKQNGGSSSARNLGIQEATGEYLGFVDSDDYVEPDMYERLLQAIETTHLPIAQTGREETSEYLRTGNGETGDSGERVPAGAVNAQRRLLLLYQISTQRSV